MLVFVGTYTQRKPHAPNAAGQGIYSYRLDPATGTLAPIGLTKDIVDPSYLTLSPQGRYLYAVSEIGDGEISAYVVDQENGALTLRNRQPTQGDGPCYVTADNGGRYVLVANYGSGSGVLYTLQPDGTLSRPESVVRHSGSSVNPERQEGPHAHAIVLDPAGQFVFVPDLGMDKVCIYALDREHQRLVENDPPFVALQPGSGPRHMAFHPSERFAFTIQELGSTIAAFRYNRERGALDILQTVSTLPTDYTGASHCADIHVHPSGHFVYGSNRGHDSIVIYAIDPETGWLTYVDHVPTQGNTPRNFAIDPTGRFLLAANQDSDTIVTFHIDPESGRLHPTGHVTEVPAPVCIKVLAAAG